MLSHIFTNYAWLEIHKFIWDSQLLDTTIHKHAIHCVQIQYHYVGAHCLNSKKWKNTNREEIIVCFNIRFEIIVLVVGFFTSPPIRQQLETQVWVCYLEKYKIGHRIDNFWDLREYQLFRCVLNSSWDTWINKFLLNVSKFLLFGENSVGYDLNLIFICLWHLPYRI